MPLTTSTGMSIDYNSRSDTFDIVHTDLTLDVRFFLNVVGTSQMKVAVLQNSSNLRFDLQNLTVDSVKVDNSGFQTMDRTNPFINLRGSYAAGDTLDVTVYYRGLPPTDPTGWGGWHRTGNLAFNLGVGFGSNPHVYGRSLFPCFDNFVEHSTFTTTLISQVGQIGVSNGVKELDSISGSERFTRWRLDDPIPSYLYAVGVSDFELLSWTHQGINGPIELEVYARGVDTANARQSFVHLGQIMDAFENHFGPYVWQRAGYTLTTIGAMEHATSIHLPRNLADGTLNGEDIIAHELAHHWFGDLITCERAEDMWFNEGWAEYLSHFYQEIVYDRERYLRVVRENRDLVLKMASVRDDGHRALVEMPQDYTYGTHTYQKGAMAAHNLRAYMGDLLFFSSLTQMFQNHAFENFSIPEFQQVLETNSGLDLSPFFEDQIEQPGYANFYVDSLVEGSMSGSNRTVDLWITQSLYAANHMYRNVPVRIHFFDEDGTEEIHEVVTDTTGSRSHRQVLTQLNDIELIVVDLTGVMLTAHSPELQWITQTGTHSFETAEMGVNVTQLSDSSLLLIEHHWVAPEAEYDQTLGWHLSSSHFWTVSGDLDGNIEAEASLIYDGRVQLGGLDGDLLTNGEDSIVLMYRPNSWSHWEEYDQYTKDTQGSTLNKLGVMRISELRAGQYCFASGVSGIGLSEGRLNKDSLKLWPNPAKNEIQIELPKSLQYQEGQQIIIYDQAGREIQFPKVSFESSKNVLTLDISELSIGSYWIDIDGRVGRFEKK